MKEVFSFAPEVRAQRLSGPRLSFKNDFRMIDLMFAGAAVAIGHRYKFQSEWDVIGTFSPSEFIQQIRDDDTRNALTELLTRMTR